MLHDRPQHLGSLLNVGLMLIAAIGGNDLRRITGRSTSRQHASRLVLKCCRRWLGRDTVEACRSIGVNQLHRKGCLRASWIGIWQWTHEGERVGWIDLRAEHDWLNLTYRVRIGGGDWQDVAETVQIVCVPCKRQFIS
jgi:hypothetical protein